MVTFESCNFMKPRIMLVERFRSFGLGRQLVLVFFAQAGPRALKVPDSEESL